MTGIVVDIDTGPMSEDSSRHLTELATQAVKTSVEYADLMHPQGAELSIVLTNDDHVQNLNLQWRSIDKPTNVLSFPGEDIRPGEMSGQLLGDIVISIDTLKREANLENKSVDDHFCHLIIHGFLHLFGYDHETDEDAETMESLERSILAKLGIADPYEIGSHP